MASGGVQVKGLRETVRTLEKFGVQVADLKAAFIKIGQNVTDEARSRVPKLSGALSASIKPSRTKNKSVVRAGSAKVPYAGVIHYGGYHGIEPHPYLTEAVQSQEHNTVSTLDEELRSLIKKYGLNN